MHRLAAFGCLQFFALRAAKLHFLAVAVAKLKSHPVLPGEIATASIYTLICAKDGGAPNFSGFLLRPSGLAAISRLRIVGHCKFRITLCITLAIEFLQNFSFARISYPVEKTAFL
jgi:hypothetical protein